MTDGRERLVADRVALLSGSSQRLSPEELARREHSR